MNKILTIYMPLILGIMAAAIVMLFILCIVLFFKIRRERQRYDYFMGVGRRPEQNLEAQLKEYFETSKGIDEKYTKLLDMVTDMDATMSRNIQKVGLVRYNPFDEMGGNLCFALALLDRKDNGVVLNGIHSRTGSFTYAKPIELGVSTYILSQEEIKAVEVAKENVYHPKAKKVLKVKTKKIFRKRDKIAEECPMKEQISLEEGTEKKEAIGDVTVDEKERIMAEEILAQEIAIAVAGTHGLITEEMLAKHEESQETDKKEE